MSRWLPHVQPHTRCPPRPYREPVSNGVPAENGGRFGRESQRGAAAAAAAALFSLSFFFLLGGVIDERPGIIARLGFRRLMALERAVLYLFIFVARLSFTLPFCVTLLRYPSTLPFFAHSRVLSLIFCENYGPSNRKFMVLSCATYWTQVKWLESFFYSYGGTK